MGFKLLFFDANEDRHVTLEAYHGCDDNIWIELEDSSCLNSIEKASVALDKASAIKLVKVLKAEISKMGKEVNNG